MTLIYIETGEAWNGEPLNAAFYPASIEKNMTDAKLATLGLMRKPADPPPPPRPVSIGDIEEETGNRIYVLFPIHKQLNAQARATELLLIGPTNWSEQERAEAAYIQSARDWIKAMREVSDDLAGADVLDPTFRDDKHWPTFPLPTEED